MSAPTKLTSLILLAVFVFPKRLVTAVESDFNELKGREPRQLFFRYRFPWPDHPIPGYPAHDHLTYGNPVPGHRVPSPSIPVYSASGHPVPVGYPISGHPITFHDNGFDHNLNQLNANYQENVKEDSLVEALSSKAVQWMINLNEDEQENLTAWALASAAVASLTQRKSIAYSSSFNPILFNGFASPNPFSHEGQKRTPFRPSSSNEQQGYPEEKNFETFLVIKEVIRRVAISIKSCQVGFFKKCAYYTTTTTTTTPSTTTATTTTSTTPMTTTMSTTTAAPPGGP